MENIDSSTENAPEYSAPPDAPNIEDAQMIRDEFGDDAQFNYNQNRNNHKIKKNLSPIASQTESIDDS